MLLLGGCDDLGCGVWSVEEDDGVTQSYSFVSMINIIGVRNLAQIVTVGLHKFLNILFVS